MDGTGYFNHIVRAPFEHVIVQQVYDKTGLDQEHSRAIYYDTRDYIIMLS